MKCIVLLGYMCAGKTTVGRVLAKDLGRTFYDLDWYVEERYHTRIADIFATEGEAKFRDLEKRMLHEVAEFEDIVLSLGGGTPCFFDNMDYVNSVADTYYLKATPEVLVEHIRMSRGHRPLLEGKTDEELEGYVREQLKVREPFYSRAHYTVDINLLDSFDRIQDIANIIKGYM